MQLFIQFFMYRDIEEGDIEAEAETESETESENGSGTLES
jgi:hypothetical protein